MTVMEYIAEFDRLTLLCELEEKEHMKIARFLKGLHNSIERDLDLASHTTFAEVCKLALKVEKRKPAPRFPSNSSTPGTTHPTPTATIPPVTPSSSVIVPQKGSEPKTPLLLPRTKFEERRR